MPMGKVWGCFSKSFVLFPFHLGCAAVHGSFPCGLAGNLPCEDLWRKTKSLWEELW